MILREAKGNIVGLHVKVKHQIYEIKSAWAKGLWLKVPEDTSGRIIPYTDDDFLDLQVSNTPRVMKKQRKIDG